MRPFEGAHSNAPRESRVVVTGVTHKIDCIIIIICTI